MGAGLPLPRPPGKGVQRAPALGVHPFSRHMQDEIGD